MPRPTVLLLAIAFGCSGTIDEGAQVAGLTPAQQLALSAWLQLAEPAFQTNTCDTCHEGQMIAAGAPPYLMGSSDVDKRDMAIATMPPVINLSSPRSSRVLVKGPHEGPALDAASATNILTWIQYEHDARPTSNLPITSPYMMMDCAGSNCPTNTVDLTPAGAAGSTVTFTEQPVADDNGGETETDMDALTVTAGPSGLHLVHPLFGTIPAGGSGSPVFDVQDRFFNTDVEVGPGSSYELATSTIFTDFVHTDPMVIQFDVLGPEDAGSGSGG